MSTITLTREEALVAEKHFANLIKNEKTKFEFAMDVKANKRQLKPCNDETRDSLEAMQKELNELAQEYCEKDEHGVPISESGRLRGLERGKHPCYDDRVDEILDARRNLLRESVTIEPKMIPQKNVPREGVGEALESLYDFIEGEK